MKFWHKCVWVWVCVCMWQKHREANIYHFSTHFIWAFVCVYVFFVYFTIIFYIFAIYCVSLYVKKKTFTYITHMQRSIHSFYIFINNNGKKFFPCMCFTKSSFGHHCSCCCCLCPCWQMIYDFMMLTGWKIIDNHNVIWK